MSIALPLPNRADAHQIDYKLTDLVHLRDAPKRWPAFTFTELLRAAKSGELPHILKGRRRYVTEAHLKQWIKSKEQACRAGSLNSENIGLTGSTAPPISTASGMTESEEIFVAEALRQAISQPPKSH